MKNFNLKEYKKACDSAIMSYTMAYLIFKRIPVKKLIVITCMLFICMVSFAQKFNKIDFRGKTASEIAQTFGTKEAQCWASTKNNDGSPAVDFYLSSDFGSILFYYTPKGICFKIVVKSHVPIIFDQSVTYTSVTDKKRNIITYTIEK